VQIDDAADISDYVVEIEILNQCDHVNIVKLLESYYSGGQISVSKITCLSALAFF
jgi:hypothetical protein